MNRQEYLSALEKALNSVGIRECDDIIDEFAEHFNLKAADGYSDEEIAARLGSPEEIAEQFRETGAEASGKPWSKAASTAASAGLAASSAVGAARGKVISLIKQKGRRVITATGIIIADIITVQLFIMLYAWIVVLAAFSFSLAALGIIMVSGLDRIAALSPYIHTVNMPYLHALIIGISVIALSVLVAVGMRYCFLYIKQLLKAYLSWHRKVWTGVRKFPPVPLHPVIEPKKRRIMRSLALVSLLVFVIALIIGLVSLMLATSSFEPWHVLGWFV